MQLGPDLGLSVGSEIVIRHAKPWLVSFFPKGRDLWCAKRTDADESHDGEIPVDMLVYRGMHGQSDVKNACACSWTGLTYHRATGPGLGRGGKVGFTLWLGIENCILAQ